MERINKINVDGTDYAVGGNEFLFMGEAELFELNNESCITIKEVIKKMSQQADTQAIYNVVFVVVDKDGSYMFNQMLVSVKHDWYTATGDFNDHKWILTFDYVEGLNSLGISLESADTSANFHISISLADDNAFTMSYQNANGEPITKEQFVDEIGLSTCLLMAIFSL